MNYSIFLQA